MKTKRILAVTLGALLLALTACGGKSASTTMCGDTVVFANPSSANDAASSRKTATEEEQEVLGEDDTGAAAATASHVDPEIDPDAEVIEITEKLFIAQTNELYLNYEDYMGKTVKYEGMYIMTEMEGSDPWHYVIRYGPGCCGYDGTAGFELDYDGEWPEDNDWCEVVGTFDTYDLNGWDMVILRVQSLTVLEERGAEYVSM